MVEKGKTLEIYPVSYLYLLESMFSQFCFYGFDGRGNTLFTDFYRRLSTKKWAMMPKCSIDPVLRSINDLIEKGMLEKYDASERSINYEVAL